MNALTPFTRFSLTTSILALSLFSTVINAEEQAAHEHGAARLTIATNDVGIEISLQSPAANIFGFEYVASSDSDHHTLQKALGTLKSGGALFLANESAGCKQASIEIESAQVDAHDSAKHKEGDDDEKHDDEKHDDEKHDDEKHDDEKHDDEKHDDHKDEASTSHNDVDATWSFTCDNADAIKQVEIKLFSAFPKGFADLDIDWITSTKSGHTELEADGLVLLK